MAIVPNMKICSIVGSDQIRRLLFLLVHFTIIIYHTIFQQIYHWIQCHSILLLLQLQGVEYAKDVYARYSVLGVDYIEKLTQALAHSWATAKEKSARYMESGKKFFQFEFEWSDFTGLW